MYKYIIFLISIIGFVSCEEVLEDIKTDESITLLTVEGFFSDKLETQNVRLSWSGDYFDESFAAVSGAKISIHEKYTGMLVSDFIEDSNDIGIYHTPHEVAGVPGSVYQLIIDIKGVLYVAEDSLAKVSSIDRLSIEANPFMPTINSLNIDAVDPKDEVNFYTWNICFDGVLLDDYSNKPFSDDRLLSDSVQNISIYDDNFEGDDNKISGIEDTVNIRVRQMGISKSGYEFMIGMNAILNKGGMFDSPMAQVQSNVWRVDENMKKLEMQTGFYFICGVSDIEMNYFEKK